MNKFDAQKHCVLVMGAGTVIIGAILKREDAKLVLVFVALIIFIIGMAMAPFAWVLKGILIAVVIVVFGYVAWRTGNAVAKSG